ncbi:MAG: helicase, partial [Desulfobacterales bacterium]|nr:helicase [Desulfobacterales bacterium]
MVTLKDKLSHLNYTQACRLLGSRGKQLILAGGKLDIDLFEQVRLNSKQFSMKLENATVAITLDSTKRRRLNIRCSDCSAACEHQGAALSLILEEKLSLGLSAPPPERIPIESLSEEALIKQAVDDRNQRAQTEKMRLKSMNPRQLWTDYIITSYASGKSYRIALRGWEFGESYCSCPDFRKNSIGTCKHILYALNKARRKFSKAVRKTPAEITEICVYLHYGRRLQLDLLVPEDLAPEIADYLAPFKGKRIQNIKKLIHGLRRVEGLGVPVTIYPDAEEHINQKLFQERVAETVAGIRKDPKNHPLRKTLLRTELLPYQLDGVAFAVGAGRAVLADDMGLGKTIQGIGVAELLSRHASVSKVLEICPASLKSQWRFEIERFSNRSSSLVLGSAKERSAQYDSESFFTVCNYEQVLRDFLSIERVRWDLIILDEGQRIKNWEA